MKMAAIAIFAATALLRYASAGNFSTNILVPNGLFAPYPMLQTFVGQSTVASGATYYTVNCGSNETNFWPGGSYPCGIENSYTFSADSANTQYLVRNINLGVEPFSNPNEIATWLQTFTQTVTINCAPLNAASTGNCTYTSLYNKEDADDKSIVHSTIVTQTAAYPESSLYPMIFTVAGAAAAAAATPLKSMASSTTTANPKPTSSSSGPPVSNSTAQHAALSSGSKAGIGIGVAIGVCALAGLALLLYRHHKRKQRSRLNQTENLVPPGSFADEPEGKSAPDNNGVYEMQGQGRQSPARYGELEG